MKAFTNYLEQIGYKPFIKKYNRKTRKWNYEDTWSGYYSSMSDLCVHWRKDDKEIVTGLHEKGKPPTLICPRPNIKVKKYFNGGVINVFNSMDDSMSRCLQKETPEDIYKALWDDSIIFEYDFR